MSETNYHKYRRMIYEFNNGESNLTEEELNDELYEAYENDELTGREYDNLTCLLD